MARSLGFRHMCDSSRGLVRAQRAVVVKVVLMTGLVGVDVAVVVDIFVDGPAVRFAGSGDSHSGASDGSVS